MKTQMTSSEHIKVIQASANTNDAIKIFFDYDLITKKQFTEISLIMIEVLEKAKI